MPVPLKVDRSKDIWRLYSKIKTGGSIEVNQRGELRTNGYASPGPLLKKEARK